MSLFRLAFLLLFSLTSACHAAPEPLATIEDAKPALWEVTGITPDQPGRAYLFGTIHILPDGVTWKTPALTQAIAQSDRLVIEVTGLEDRANAKAIFAKLAVSPGQAPLDERVRPSLRDDLDTAVSDAGLPEPSLDRMESWAVALTLASARSASIGLSAGTGVEKALVEEFAIAKKPVIGLETIAQQLGYFDTLPETNQRLLIENVLEESGDTKSLFENLFNAWARGDTAALVTLSEDSLLKEPVTRDALLIKRNANWAVQIGAMLQKPGTIFVAVGAAHLVGPDALQKSLGQQGYKITRIQ